MIVTEEEAAKRWCPMVRTVAVGTGQMVSGNRVFRNKEERHDNPPVSRCIGSECMMWRWVGAVFQRHRWPVVAGGKGAASLLEEPARDPLTPKSWNWVHGDPQQGGSGYWEEPEAEAFARREGYCGLSRSSREA